MLIAAAIHLDASDKPLPVADEILLTTTMHAENCELPIRAPARFKGRSR